MLTRSLRRPKKLLELSVVKKLSNKERIKISSLKYDLSGKLCRAELHHLISYPSKVIENPNEKCTQTEISFKKPINMKHEGMKFMAERIINFEAKRIHGDFELCCIADENVYPKSIKGIVEKVMENLDAVQEKEQYPNWERHEVRKVSLDSEELPKKKPKATMVDKITQYGEDNPDEDFQKGMIDIAKKVLDSESARLKNEHGFDMFDVRKNKEFKKWKSKTPAKLVDELNEKMYNMRHQKADWDDEEENGYGYGKWRWG